MSLILCKVGSVRTKITFIWFCLYIRTWSQKQWWLSGVTTNKGLYMQINTTSHPMELSVRFGVIFGSFKLLPADLTSYWIKSIPLWSLVLDEVDLFLPHSDRLNPSQFLKDALSLCGWFLAGITQNCWSYLFEEIFLPSQGDFLHNPRNPLVRVLGPTRHLARSVPITPSAIDQVNLMSHP